jgi:hypothetical protein
MTFEQLDLFGPHDQEPEPQPEPERNPYEDTFWKPKTFYRYNENGRPSGWVKVERERYVANVYIHELHKRLTADYLLIDEKRYSHTGRITPEDLQEYFEQIERPEWLQNDD